MVLAVEGIPGALAPLPAVGAPPLLPVLPVVDPVLVPVPLPVFAPFPDGLPTAGAGVPEAVTGLLELKLPPPHPASRARGNRARLWRNSFLIRGTVSLLVVGLI